MRIRTKQERKLMCELDFKHPCCSPGEIVRNYYRAQGREQERQFIIQELTDFCESEHSWADHCECWMYIKMLKDNK